MDTKTNNTSRHSIFYYAKTDIFDLKNGLIVFYYPKNNGDLDMSRIHGNDRTIAK